MLWKPQNYNNYLIVTFNKLRCFPLGMTMLQPAQDEWFLLHLVALQPNVTSANVF